MEKKNLATIGVFGGSGFYKFLDDAVKLSPRCRGLSVSRFELNREVI